MVYGAFSEDIMREAYERLLQSPLGQYNLIDSAADICAELDRMLVEVIWPAKRKQQTQLQEKEIERPAKPEDNTSDKEEE